MDEHKREIVRNLAPPPETRIYNSGANEKAFSDCVISRYFVPAGQLGLARAESGVRLRAARLHKP